jgi:hypothetical protein
MAGPKIIFLIGCFAFLGSCSTESRLFDFKNDIGRFVATSGDLRGAYFITVKKYGKSTNGRISHTPEYELVYDCPCNDQKKNLTQYKQHHEIWLAMTDTSQLKIFDVTLRPEIVQSPKEFEPMTREQIDLLQKAFDANPKACCIDTEKCLSNVIGFLKRVPVPGN